MFEPASPALEHMHGVVVEVDAASAGARLDAELDGLAADVLHGASHCEAGVGGGEVGPFEADDLLASHAGVGGEVQRGVEALSV